MGTRTVHDLVQAGWSGQILPVSTRHAEIEGLRAWRSLRDLPVAPDVVLARTPSAGVEALVDDAIAVGAGYLVLLAAGFAEAGETGRHAQAELVARARRGGVRIVGPQSIGLIHAAAGLPLSLSQIMERFVLRDGPVALLTQSGAMAISLAVRGQQHLGLDFGVVATFGNAADVTPTEMLDWLSTQPATRAIGLYLEGLADADAFAQAISRCRAAGQHVVVLRAGLSAGGAAAVASHTASISGDGDAFRALCRQLGVVLCESSEPFLWALKALAGHLPSQAPRVAFASISGGACALWADQGERLGFALPALNEESAAALATHLPPFLSPANPLDLGPVVFDDELFEKSLDGLASAPPFNMLVVYLFTSSPSLMGGLRKVALLESLAARIGRPLWVIWEAATDEEWAALVCSKALTAFRDLGQAAQAISALGAALGPRRGGSGYRAMADASQTDVPPVLDTEPAVKAWLQRAGLCVPRGMVCRDPDAAAQFAASCATRVAVKIVSAAVPHKTEVGGVILCPNDQTAVEAAYRKVLQALRTNKPDITAEGVLVESLVDDKGLELVVTVRRSANMGMVTVVGRGGVQVEIDPDVVVHVGMLDESDVTGLVDGLRCAALFRGHRGGPALNEKALGRTLVRLQRALLDADLSELEINPLLLTPGEAWVLDALAFRRQP